MVIYLLSVHFLGGSIIVIGETRENKKIEPVKRLEQTNYSRDATKRTIEKGINIDLLV